MIIEKPKNKKIMLWISEDLLIRLDKLKAADVSYQECIRQLLDKTVKDLEKKMLLGSRK